jgi:hypothetical protein
MKSLRLRLKLFSRNDAILLAEWREPSGTSRFATGRLAPFRFNGASVDTVRLV